MRTKGGPDGAELVPLYLVTESGETESAVPFGNVEKRSRKAFHIVSDLAEEFGEDLVNAL